MRHAGLSLLLLETHAIKCTERSIYLALHLGMGK